MQPITIETTVNADAQKTWDAWTTPADIMVWNHAEDSWECPAATVDLRVGGTFSSTMAAKDGSFKFEFGGTYTAVEPLKLIAFTMGGEDGRKVTVAFEPVDGGTRIVETFDPETQNSEEKQRSGWQMILDNFKKHVESK